MQQNISGFDLAASALHNPAKCCFIYARFLADSIAAFLALSYLLSYFLDYHNYHFTHYLMFVKDKILKIIKFFYRRLPLPAMPVVAAAPAPGVPPLSIPARSAALCQIYD